MRYLFSILAIVCTIYFPWFAVTRTLSSGDWPYLYPENINSFRLFTQPPFLWLDTYYQLTAKLGVEVFSLSWEVTEKIFWFYPFILLAVFGFFIFARRYIYSPFAAIGALIYSTNTYALMIAGGGQMGVAIAYAIAPLVLTRLITLVGNDIFLNQKIKNQKSKIKNTVQNSKLLKSLTINGFILAVQLMFDPRIFLITLFGFFIYILFLWIVGKGIDFVKIRDSIFVLLLAVVFNLFWIIPNIDFFQHAYSETAIAANVSFLSFASFSNSLSLLHPNWPENIFGKIYFMKGEFLMLPIFAFSSLLFISKIPAKQDLASRDKNQKDKNNLTIEQFSNRTVLFFVLLGLLGAFLAKGVNGPFGELYLWLSNIPGATLFRDPTKFYLLVVLSYSVLIPFSLYSAQEWLKSKVKNQKYLPNLFLLFAISYLIFLIRPAIFKQLNGTFKPQKVPYEYINFKNFLISQPDFSYILWVPARQRFGASFENHPYLNAEDIIQADSISDLLNEFRKKETKKIINDYEIGYVVVPYDSKKEIFLTDRKYDENLYKKIIQELSKLSWFKQVYFGKNKNFGKIAVFELLD